MLMEGSAGRRILHGFTLATPVPIQTGHSICCRTGSVWA